MSQRRNQDEPSVPCQKEKKNYCIMLTHRGCSQVRSSGKKSNELILYLSYSPDLTQLNFFFI